MAQMNNWIINIVTNPASIPDSMINAVRNFLTCFFLSL